MTGTDTSQPPPAMPGDAGARGPPQPLAPAAPPPASPPALVFCSDLDRTLTGPDLVPDPQALAAVRRLRDVGARCVLVTGRPQADVAAHPAVVAAFDAFVLEGGALWGPWDDLWAASNGAVALAAADRLAAAGVRVNRRRASCNAKADAHEQVFALAGDCSIQRNADEYDILPPGHDKGTGLDAVLARLGLRSARVVAVGDGDNDLPFFERADYGVAVANAGELLKASADEVLERPGPEGVVALIDRLLASPLTADATPPVAAPPSPTPSAA